MSDARGLEESFADIVESLIDGFIAKAGLQGLQVSALDEARLVAHGGRLADEMREALARARTCAVATVIPQGSPHAHSLQSGMASAAENVTARALGVKPQLRVIEGGNSRDVRKPLDETNDESQAKAVTL